jgi:hypothetical protein
LWRRSRNLFLAGIHRTFHKGSQSLADKEQSTCETELWFSNTARQAPCYNPQHTRYDSVQVFT